MTEQIQNASFHSIKDSRLGDKGTAELTLHLNPTCNLIRTADAKGWATYKQRSLATWGARAGERQPIRPASNPQLTARFLTFALILSYLSWALQGRHCAPAQAGLFKSTLVQSLLVWSCMGTKSQSRMTSIRHRARAVTDSRRGW